MKKYIIGVGLLASLSSLALVGLMNSTNNIETLAASGETSSWGLRGTGDGLSWDQNVSFTTTNSGTLHSWKNYSFTAGTVFKVTNGTTWLGYSNITFGDAKTHFKVSGDQGNIECVDSGSYDVCVAWNGSADCIGIWPSGTLSNNLHWEEIYILQYPNNNGYWNPSKIYSLGGLNQFGDFGTSANIDSSASGTVNLAGQYGNIRSVSYLPASYTGDDQFILHDGSGYQSNDTAYVNGAAYYFGDQPYDKANLSYSTELGIAAKFIIDAEYYRNSVSEDGDKILNYSICGIDPSNAATIYEKYEEISATSATVKGYIDDTTVTTYSGKYNGKDVPSNKTVSYAEIMPEIYKIALRDNSFASNHANNISSFNSAINPNASIMLITCITAGIVVIGLGSIAIIKRRRAE